jgi:3-dehydroquinate dehydratase/shikimate dehydrogenase
MNDRGFISRVLCPKFGGYLTFGSLERGKESAPAQPTVADLINVYNIRQIGPDTKVFGIIGKPVGHSKSPILHNEAFRSVGLNAVYVPFLVDDLAKFLHTYSSPDFAGFRYLILVSQVNCYTTFSWFCLCNHIYYFSACDQTIILSIQ